MHAVVIRRFYLNEAPFGLFKFISDYLPYFEKKLYIFQYHNKKSLNNSPLYPRGDESHEQKKFNQVCCPFFIYN
jgi:hypothetical protein